MQRQPRITIVHCVVTKIGECCERIGEIEIDHERRRCSGGWSEPGGAHKNVGDDHLYFGESLVEVGGIENRRNDVNTAEEVRLKKSHIEVKNMELDDERQFW